MSWQSWRFEKATSIYNLFRCLLKNIYQLNYTYMNCRYSWGFRKYIFINYFPSFRHPVNKNLEIGKPDTYHVTSCNKKWESCCRFGTGYYKFLRSYLRRCIELGRSPKNAFIVPVRKLYWFLNPNATILYCIHLCANYDEGAKVELNEGIHVINYGNSKD